MFSRRSAVPADPDPLSLALSRASESGRPVLDLTQSNPTRALLPYDEGAILGALGDPRALSYEPQPFGLASARQAVAGLWADQGVRIDPRRIVLTASTSEAYAVLFKLLCDPGDEVLVPEPSYPLFEHLARFEGVRPVSYRLVHDGAWHLDVDSIRAARTSRTRAFVVVHPNNPTGSYVKRAELREIESLELPIVSDEVFAGYALSRDPTRVESMLEARTSLVVALGGLSKLAALPQMKLAWATLAGSEPVVENALSRLEILLDAYLSPGAPVQVALPTLLTARRTTEVALRARLRDNLASLIRHVAGTPLTVLEPEGGWMVVVRLPATKTEDAWVRGFLDDGVLVHPGWFYDFATAGPPHMVLSLLTPPAVWSEGVERIVRCVALGTG
jgi:aspartate/methionine/tyrosine aminotransferase